MVKSSRTASDAIVDEYVRALRDYAGEMRLPGLDISSAPLPLDSIFIEPRLISLEKAPQGDDGKTARDAPAGPVPELASAVLAREQSLVLVAEPGRGKSTLLRQYAWRLTAMR